MFQDYRPKDFIRLARGGVITSATGSFTLLIDDGPEMPVTFGYAVDHALQSTATTSITNFLWPSRGALIRLYFRSNIYG